MIEHLTQIRTALPAAIPYECTLPRRASGDAPARLRAWSGGGAARSGGGAGGGRSGGAAGGVGGKKPAASGSTGVGGGTRYYEQSLRAGRGELAAKYL